MPGALEALNDFFSRPVAIGDTVAFIETHYRNFKRGLVVAMTAKKLRIRYATSYRSQPFDETLRFPCEVIKE